MTKADCAMNLEAPRSNLCGHVILGFSRRNWRKTQNLSRSGLYSSKHFNGML